ncbi:ABC transporter permease [Methylopila sp. M107]|uniref:ABC transporter permease n=1 Tax=Methylopila sp. M107 TaxID=1101190 RepID=UPI00036D7A47|nr:ABC transporter permease [Methylopila sp. M107]
MSQSSVTEEPRSIGARVGDAVKQLFIRFGILPFLLVIVVAFFAIEEPRFLSAVNLTNVARQSTFLMIVAMAQMLVLIAAGMDLSVGALIGLVTVVAGVVMKSMAAGGMDVGAAISLGIAAGLGVSLLVGMFNAVCVALIGLSPFIATLGTMTALTGIALMVSGGVSIGGIPRAYADVFAIERYFGLQMPIIVTIAVFLIGYFMLNHTVLGRYLYAMGSNARAARLSGVNTIAVPFMAYMLCSLVAGIAGLLVLARTSTGGAGIGSEYGLQSVTACVIAGVSLFGGTGRIGGVVLGALFLALLSNGMNILQIQSYSQMVVLGCILILALIGDRIRMRLVGQRGGVR